ncbi:MAG TPA: M12 family metallopeptidase [Longimicrobium sp.]|nr:M12 family metallopeptidase [Longimicrobium sp.]
MPRPGHLLSLAVLSLLAACGDDGVGTPAVPSPTQTEGYLTRGELRTGWVLGPDGAPREITFEVQGELAIVEGDIVIGEADRIPATREGLERMGRGGPRLGVVVDGTSYRWPAAVVPYVLAKNLPDKQKVLDAMAHIEALTGNVDFVARTSQADYINVVAGSGCSSWVGRQGGAQQVEIGRWCGFGAAVHELSHALGMHHEQSRCDRGAYVEILYQNIQQGAAYNFDAQCTGYSDLFEYAEGSVMHYGPTAFSKNGQPTIRSLRGLDHLMGQRVGLGATDITTINALYP